MDIPQFYNIYNTFKYFGYKSGTYYSLVLMSMCFRMNRIFHKYGIHPFVLNSTLILQAAAWNSKYSVLTETESHTKGTIFKM